MKVRKNNLVQTLESWGPTFTISVEIKITSFEEQEAGHCIPTLFPARLLDSCLAKVQGLVYTTGV